MKAVWIPAPMETRRILPQWITDPSGLNAFKYAEYRANRNNHGQRDFDFGVVLQGKFRKAEQVQTDHRHHHRQNEPERKNAGGCSGSDSRSSGQQGQGGQKGG